MANFKESFDFGWEPLLPRRIKITCDPEAQHRATNKALEVIPPHEDGLYPVNKENQLRA